MAAPEPPDRDTLVELAELLRAALSDNAIGGYLHGSTGRARLFPRSDLDLLVVTRTPLTSTQRSALTDLALSKSGRYPPLPGGPRPVELTVVPESEVKPWRYPPRCDFLYGEWLREGVESGAVLAPFECPDLAILVTMARTADAPLFGPSALDVFEEVPGRDVVSSVTHGLPSLMDALTSDTTNVLLTLVRAWRTCETGEIVSKDVAADWAIPRLAGGGIVLEHARAVYLGATAEDWSRLRTEVESTAHRLVEAVQVAARSGLRPKEPGRAE